MKAHRKNEALIYIAVGLVFTALIAWKWRDAIWNDGRPAHTGSE